MYARPIRISRGVISAVRSCSYPNGWLRDDQRERSIFENVSVFLKAPQVRLEQVKGSVMRVDLGRKTKVRSSAA